MFKKIQELFYDLENWLIQKIDCEGDYDESMPIETYMMAMYPTEYALYTLINDYLEKKAAEQENK